jgi:drug/metabolite transporter (DMT)-like permease
MTKHRHWTDLSPGRRAWFVGAIGVQLALAGLAWTDLARRPQERVRGRKPLWAGVIGVTFIGPIAYLLFGREAPDHASTTPPP